MDLTPNAVIAGRYQVERKVGAGGMGEVWLGQQVGIGVRVAIKTLLPATATNNEVIARFKREAFLLAQIRSDHVARVVDFVTDDDYGLVLVMEFVEGDPLSRILQEKTLTVEEAIDLGVGIASALKDLHKANIIHRDLKPGNIIMAPTPDGRRRAVVVDFGVSRMMNDKSKDEDEELTGITRADMAVGTIEYMAPEQILNSRNVAPGSDIYAAGAMLFRAAAGRHIFDQAKSDAQLAQQKLTTDAPPLPLSRADKAAEGLVRVVGKMIKRRPSERYKAADEVLADLVPVRDMARGAVAELESTTIDAGRGLTVPMPASGVPLPARPSPAQAALVAPPAPTPAGTAQPTPAGTAQPTPTSTPASVGGPASAGAPVSAGAPASAPTSSGVPASAPAPISADSSVSVSAPHLPPKEAPARRGVSPIVTFGLVAAALAAGIFLGPRLMAPTTPAAVPEPPSAAPAATEAPSASATPTAPAAAAATAAPSAAASAAAVPPSASAAAAPTALPGAAPTGPGVPGPLPVAAPPAPLPKPAPPAPTAQAPAPKPKAPAVIGIPVAPKPDAPKPGTVNPGGI